MNIFDSINIKELELKNRFVMAPMCMYEASEDGHVKPFHLIHYPTRAYGGVGLILQEATAVESRGRISSNDLGIWDDSHVEGLKKIVDAVHLGGAKIGIQLAHAGRKCLAKGEEVIAPSVVPFSERYPVPKELSTVQIREIISCFGQAAKRAKQAGYDLIEVHGAHGYLVNQFLSPLSNLRTDEYGGTAEKRHRFLKEVLAEVAKYWDGPISVRLSAEEYAPEGNHIEDTLSLLKDLKGQVDLVNVSSGGVVPVVYDAYPGYQLSFANAVKQLGFVTIGGGLLTTREEIKEALDNFDADLFYLGRVLLRDPYFVLKTARDEGRSDLIIKPYERGFK